MASYDISNIRAALKALLQTVTKLAFVYDFKQSNVEGYPCAIFDMSNEEATMLDDANNLRVVTFTIWIACELPVGGIQTTKGRLDAVVKDVINTLELKANDTLSGNVDWIIPVIGKRTEANSPEGVIAYQEIILKANVSSTIV